MKEQSICTQTERVTKISSCDEINTPQGLKQSRLIEMIVFSLSCLMLLMLSPLSLNYELSCCLRFSSSLDKDSHSPHFRLWHLRSVLFVVQVMSDVSNQDYIPYFSAYSPPPPLPSAYRPPADKTTFFLTLVLLHV